MKIYGHPQSSSTRKVLFALAEKNQPFEFEVVDLFAHAQKSIAHLSRHPFGMVPVLEDGDFSLYESRAILRYLDARFSPSSLTPPSTQGRARMDQFMSIDQSYVAPHCRALAIERLLRKRDGMPARADITEAAEQGLRTAFSIVDRALQRHAHVACDSFSLADISLAPYVASLPMIGADRTVADCPHVLAWYGRITMRPSWKNMMARTSEKKVG